MNLNNKKSFTLIELLVVISIIAVLAAVSIPAITGVIQRAQDAAITADMRAIYVQAMRLQIDTGTFAAVHCGTGANPDIVAMCASIDGANGTPTGTPNNVINHASATAFCIQSPLHGGGFRCADHHGHWHIPTTHCTATVIRCRALPSP